jgi:hypothetical protein
MPGWLVGSSAVPGTRSVPKLAAGLLQTAGRPVLVAKGSWCHATPRNDTRPHISLALIVDGADEGGRVISAIVQGGAP